VPDPIQRIFTATLLIGRSGQGKTSLAATFAEYLWEQFQKVLLLYSCDGGAFPTIIQRRIRQGLIRAWRLRTRSAEGLAFETCYLASKGYWPRTIRPETGETAPAVELVPPVTARYVLTCAKGHHLKTVPSVSMIGPTFCGTCKAMETPATMIVREEAQQTRGFEQVGGVFFDGITSMCGWFMGELDVSRGMGNIGGEKPPLGGPVRSGGVRFGGNNRADYGFAQQRAYQIVHNSLSIPNLHEGPVWTALPDDVTEGGGQLPVVGPKLAGSALTADALQWFGNAVEARIEKSDKDHDIRRLYLSEFVDSQNRRHLLKNSGPGTLPKYLEDPPIDPVQPDPKQFFTGFNLGHFFKLLDQALQADLEADEQLGAVPGISGAPGDYGDATTVETGAAAPPPEGAAAPTTPAAPSTPPVTGGDTPKMTPRRKRATPAAPPTIFSQPAPQTPAQTAPAPAQAPPPPQPSPEPQTLPIVQPAPTAPQPAASQPTAAPAPAPPRVTPRASGTVPPPPGMRPPQRLPGR